MENFSKVLISGNIKRQQQKKSFHMIISEITINKLSEIGSIKLNIKDKLIDYLDKEEGVTIEGTPSSFMLKNIGINTLYLDVDI
ncbi:hypothetical protein [Clostridium sp. 'White wine YQ']|uniref:hypothetical protein n=1 Tax=Clostridium sp. 'White wine YQ' TaxID=3027474 RepID=UPI002366DF35|nr:hypothetical protein [Clostridium sp. 'White wine YQ']MDD7795411.1 hypothetical protein [Clostridium sp. 'White wine YQ']